MDSETQKTAPSSGTVSAFDQFFGDSEETGEDQDQQQEQQAASPDENAPGDLEEDAETPPADAPVGEETDDNAEVESEEEMPPAQDEELEKLRQELRATQGRLKAASEELAGFKEQPASSQQPGEQFEAAPPKAERVEIPESLQADAAEFDEQYPELSDALRMPGKDGDRVRRILRDLGPDMASMALETVLTKTGVEKKLQDADAQYQARSGQEHLERIAGEHPEMRGFVSGESDELQASQQFVQGVRSWVESLPYIKAQERLTVLQNGSARQVNALLAEYKKQTKAPRKKQLDAETRRRALDAEGVDSNRATHLATDRNDTRAGVDAVFDKFFGDE